MCEIVEKFLKNLWKIKAYDKIIEKNTWQLKKIML
jgi:hypothetical protein